jgi:hypothetical protein
VILEATATDSASGMAPTGDGAPFTAIRIDGGAPILSAGASARATVVGNGVHTVAHYARDAAGNANDGGSTNGHPNAPPSTARVRIDRDPPSVAFIGSADPREPELIEARASDPLSGPDGERGVIAVRPAGSDDRFEPLPTEGRGETLWARWRSDDYPEGEYEFRATGYDAAGNSATSGRRLNGSPMILPNPLKARTLLRAGLLASGDLGRLLASSSPYRGITRQSIVARGQTATLDGRLIATSDLPMAGRQIRVLERFDAGAPVTTRTTLVETDDRGRFGLRLAPGPSRYVEARFAGTAGATAARSRPLRLGVRGGVRMRVSAPLARVGGNPVSFRGAVACSPGRGALACSPAEIPPGGVSVQLQFRAPGLDWTEFRTLRTDRRGRFHYSYRFSDDDSRGVRFRFRAVVPAQSDWPYEPGGSRPVAVRGA